MAIGVAKSVIMRGARSKGWDCKHKGIYIYENEDKHNILSSVTLCSRATDAPSESSYVEDIVRIVAVNNYWTLDKS